MLFRYKKVIDQYTTHYAEPPRDGNGNADPTWFEHCTLADGYTYVTCNEPAPVQAPIIEWELINAPTEQRYQQVMDASVHSELMGQRIAAGKYMRADLHIVDGDDTQIAEWAARGVLAWGDPVLWTINPVMQNDERIFNDKLWKSLIDYNVWEPPIGWREVVATGYPEWVQPTGAHDAYSIGARVMFNTKVYESLIDANVWSPATYPAGWVEVVN
jgi:hypothetical protein